MKLRDIKTCFLGTHFLWPYYDYDFDAIERAELTGRVPRRVLKELRSELCQAIKRDRYCREQGERASERDEMLVAEWGSYGGLS